jgi:hypothetical protein
MQKKTILTAYLLVLLVIGTSCNKKEEINTFISTQGQIKATIGKNPVKFTIIKQKQPYKHILELSGEDAEGNSIMIVMSNTLDPTKDLFDENLIGKAQPLSIGLVYQNGKYTSSYETQELTITAIDRQIKQLKGKFKFSAFNAVKFPQEKELLSVEDGYFELILK